MKHAFQMFLIGLAAVALVACANPLTTAQKPKAGAAEGRSLSAGFAGDVTIKAAANGKFVTVSGTTVIASAAGAGNAETFTLEPQANGTYAIKAKANGKYVCADKDLKGSLVANRDAPQGWEQFTLVPQGGDLYGLKAASTGQFVCADNAGAAQLIANRDSVQGWETFTVSSGGTPPTGLTVACTDQAAWNNGYNGRLVVTNGTAAAVSDWTISFDLNATIDKLYNASFTQTGSKVTVTPAPGAAAIPAGGTSPEIIFTVYNSLNRPANVSVSGGGGDLAIPAAPTGVAATGRDASILVSWAATPGAAGYNIYYSTTAGSGVSGTKLATVASPATIASLANGTVYYVVVTAFNAKGESAASAEQPATPAKSDAWVWPAPSGKKYAHGKKQSTSTPLMDSVYDGWHATPWDGFSYQGASGMWITNNIWGMDPKYGNGTGESSVFQEMVNGVPTFGWAWDVKANAVPGEPWPHVVAYPSIGWGWSPNSGQWWNGAVAMPKIKDNKKITVDFNIRRDMDGGGAWNNAFDIWIYPQQYPGPGSGNPNSKGGYELMIWFDHQVQGPWGDNPQDVYNLNGKHWKSYNNDGTAGWTVLTYINQDSAINDGRGWSVSDVINDAARRYGISGECYINAIEFGAETCGASTVGVSNAGIMEVANWKINIQ